jgi:hypothetical protein
MDRRGSIATPGSFPFYAAIIVTVLATYSSPLTSIYAFSDDYPFLESALANKVILVKYSFVLAGRPVLALLSGPVLEQLDNIGDLRFVRLIGILGIAALACCFFKALSSGVFEKLESALVALVICTLPSFQVIAAWASTAFFPYAALLAAASWHFAERAQTRLIWSDFLISWALLTLSLGIYQPAAMFFVFFFLISLLRDHPHLPGAPSRLLVPSVILALALLAGYAFAVLGPFSLIGITRTDRSALSGDLLGKVAWFLREPLVNALNFHNIYSMELVAVATGASMIYALVRYWNQSALEGVAFLLLCMVLLPVAYLPNLAVTENWASYRSLPVLSALTALYGALSIKGLTRSLRPKLQSPFLKASLIAAALISTVVASRTVRDYFVVPQTAELAVLHALVRESPVHPDGRVIFIPPTWEQHLAPGVRYDEFGLPSASKPWVPEAMYRILQRSATASPPVFLLRDSQTQLEVRQEDVIIDMKTALRKKKVELAGSTP